MRHSLSNYFIFFPFCLPSLSVCRILWSRVLLCYLRAKAGMKVTNQFRLLCLQTSYNYLWDAITSHLLSSPFSSDTILFLKLHPNGATQSAVQDAPLALITKPRRQSHTPNSRPLLAATSPPYLMPINLSTVTKETLNSSVSPHKSSASTLTSRSATSRSVLHEGKSLTKNNPYPSVVDLTRNSEGDFHSRKGSDDSLGDDCDDDDEESGSSLSG